MKTQAESRKKPATKSPEIGAAFYPGKEEWKNEPGNRYTPQDLQVMNENWKVEIKNPDTPRSCEAD